MFIISVYDLTDGREILSRAFDDFARANYFYWNMVKAWRDDPAEDDFRPGYHPYDALFYLYTGEIVCGFGEELPR
jgi:hypothetical protein